MQYYSGDLIYDVTSLKALYHADRAKRCHKTSISQGNLQQSITRKAMKRSIVFWRADYVINVEDRETR